MKQTTKSIQTKIKRLQRHPFKSNLKKINALQNELIRVHNSGFIQGINNFRKSHHVPRAAEKRVGLGKAFNPTITKRDYLSKTPKTRY